MLNRGACWFSLLVISLLAACNLTANQGDGADHGAPAVTLVAPKAESEIDLGTHVSIQARVERAGADILSAEILIDGERIRLRERPNREAADRFVITDAWLADSGGLHEIQVVVCRAAGACGESAVVPFTVLAPPTPIPATEESAMNQDELATVTAETTLEATAEVATARVIIDSLNVRTGPSLRFALVDTLARDEEVRIFARTEDGTWFKIFQAGEERWIYGDEAAGYVAVNGPYESLPVDTGPPAPTQPPATATAMPRPFPNLVIEGAYVNPPVLSCGGASTLQFRVRNQGTVSTNWGGKVLLRDVHESSGEERRFSAPSFGILAPGESSPLITINFTVDAHYEEQHVLILEIDAQEQISEANEADNRWQNTYVLARGNCP